VIKRFAIAYIIIAAFFFANYSFAYDPLEINNVNVRTLELSAFDAQRQREIPILVYMGDDWSKTSKPVILFSHGLGGSRYNSAYLGKHWASRGYIAVFLQHIGSDESVWKGKGLLRKIFSLKKAASGENFKLRVFDVPAVLDQLSIWNSQRSHPLYGMLDMNGVGMSGHSFGAITTQAVSGQKFPSLGVNFTDRRIKAAAIFSPSKPKYGGSIDGMFGSVSTPWLLMTGTHDDSPIGKITPESRLAVYPALPSGDKYEIVLNNANHFVFTERSLRKKEKARNPNHHRVILALSTAFWDSYLKGNFEAYRWLNGSGPLNVMESADRWQKK